MKLLGKVNDNSIVFKGGALSDFSSGQIVECHVMTARKNNHLDQAHALCAFAWHNWRDNKYNSYDEFRQYMSIELGYTRVCLTMIGGSLEPVIVADTWGYKSSEQKFMKRLYTPMIKLLTTYFKCSFEELVQMSQEHKFISHDKRE